MSLQLVQNYDSDEDEERFKRAAFAHDGDLSNSSASDAEVSDDYDEASEKAAEPEKGEDIEGNGGKERARGALTAGRSDAGALTAGRIGGVRRTAAGFLPEKGPSGLPSAAAAFEAVEGPPSFLAPTALAHHMHIPRADKLVAMGSANEDMPRGIVSVAGAAAAAPAAVVFRERRAGGVGGGAREIVAAPVRNPNATSPAAAAEEEGSTQASEGANAANGNAPGGRKAVGVSMPPKADAADLLRICPTCQVPKTFSSGQGVVCPICRDKPAGGADVEVGREKAKKREGDSKVKDKEKIKRMKGQSSHATWKSETEMQLRQTYD
ncbi:hypothetical protein CLOM_g3643 [Closterium sp. NIES-68]|nr:hypothetical protein CLOM_g3643 [Closterium sp. NIES-68]GJP66555.1 hypothetical protein CLOP_g23475 [Closterium sp. NIES-67]